MARDNERVTAKSDRELIEEIAGRCRRVETKTTIVANYLGLDAGETKPVFNPEERIVWIKTPRTSIEDIIEAIGDHAGSMTVCCGEKKLAVILL